MTTPSRRRPATGALALFSSLAAVACSDPSLATVIDASTGFATRTIKHFSGYNVIVDGWDSGNELY